MKFDESKMLILVVSIMLGFLLASQISFGKPNPEQIYTFQSYQQAVAELNKLNDEIMMLDAQERKLKMDMLKYSYNSQSSSEIIKQIEDELYKDYFNEGLMDVKGPGIMVTVTDNPSAWNDNESWYLLKDSIVHDLDLMELVWEIKNQGAEAVSVNDQRVIHITEFFCDGSVIIINGVRLAPPYVIKAIGDPKVLSFALSQDGSKLREMEDRGLLIISRDLIRQDDIIIHGYKGSLGYKYMQQVKD